MPVWSLERSLIQEKFVFACSGDIDRLKEYTLCCFEYLLAKIHGLSMEQLLWELEIICSNILDADVLLVQATLKNVAEIVSRDPILLAGEIIQRLKNIKGCVSSVSSLKIASKLESSGNYHEHIESLFVQAHDWCE